MWLLARTLRIIANTTQQPDSQMRGVPRARRAISSAPSRSTGVSSRRAERLTIAVRSASVVVIQPRSTSPKRLRIGALTSPCRVVAPIAVELLQRHRVRARARSCPDQDVEMKILQR